MHDSFYWETSAISDATLYAWQRWVSVRHMHAPEQRCRTCNCFLRVTRAQSVTVCDPCREKTEEKRLLQKPKEQQRGRRTEIMRSAQMITEKIIERFWSFCRNGTQDECWKWTGEKSPKGAPVFFGNGRVLSARRVSWQIHKGEINDNRKLFTRCRPDCVNPAHLFHVHDKQQPKRKTKAQDADNIKTLSCALRGLGYTVVKIARD